MAPIFNTRWCFECSLIWQRLGLADGTFRLGHLDAVLRDRLVLDFSLGGGHQEVDLGHKVFRIDRAVRGMTEDPILELTADLVHEVLPDARVSQHHRVLLLL